MAPICCISMFTTTGLGCPATAALLRRLQSNLQARGPIRVSTRVGQSCHSRISISIAKHPAGNSMSATCRDIAASLEMQLMRVSC